MFRALLEPIKNLMTKCTLLKYFVVIMSFKKMLCWHKREWRLPKYIDNYRTPTWDTLKDNS